MSLFRTPFALTCPLDSYEEYQTLLIVGSLERVQTVLSTLPLNSSADQEIHPAFTYPLTVLEKKKNGGEVHVFVEEQEVILIDDVI